MLSRTKWILGNLWWVWSADNWPCSNYRRLIGLQDVDGGDLRFANAVAGASFGNVLISKDIGKVGLGSGL